MITWRQTFYAKSVSLNLGSFEAWLTLDILQGGSRFQNRTYHDVQVRLLGIPSFINHLWFVWRGNFV
jgi:hypothetical protein